MKQIILEERLVDKGYGYIYLDHQGVNRKLLNNILQKLKSIFKASKAVLEIKLKKLGYLNIAYENKDSLLKFMQNFKEKFK